MVHAGNAAGEFRRIPLAGRHGQGKHAQVDASDYPHLCDHTWTLSTCRGKPGYVYGVLGGRKVAMHRVILGLQVGDGRLVDHVNGDPLDNRRANLRLATPGENRRNSAAQYSDSTPFKGVSPTRSGRRFRAEIRARGTYRFLGVYDTPEEAARAYDAAAAELHGEFALTNADAGLLAEVPA